MEPQTAAQPTQNSLFAITEGHDSDIGTTEFWGFRLGPPQQQGAQRSAEKTFNILIVGMGKRNGRAWPTLPLMRYRVGMERR